MIKTITLLTIPLFLLSCASTHSSMRGTVAMKTSENTAHICMGDNEVKKGDKISFIKNKCEFPDGSPRDGEMVKCELIKIGEGEIINTLNSHYSNVKTDGSFKFKEGTLVQKIEKL